MNQKRILALGKLGLLFGGPVALVLGLFSCGVYFGSTRHVGILDFERDWLGLDVGEADAEGGGDRSGDARADKDRADKDRADKDRADKDRVAKDRVAKEGPQANRPGRDRSVNGGPADEKEARDPSADGPVAKESSGGGADRTAPPPEPEPAVLQPPRAPDMGPASRVEPLDSALEARRAMAVTVRLKVLVDPAWINTHVDWIDYVQRTVAQASAVYQAQFGITLELSAVGRWPVSSAGKDAGQLLEDLRTRSRERSDVLVGLTERSAPGHPSGKADTPLDETPHNGSYAVIYAAPGSVRPHVRTLLHELGHTLGAKDVLDRTAAEWFAKSWMSYAPARDGDAPWIGPRNRARILERKDMPFEPEPEPEPAGLDPLDVEPTPPSGVAGATEEESP